MQDTKFYKPQDLVLKVNQNCDPNELDLEAWDSFLNLRFGKTCPSYYTKKDFADSKF